MPALRVMHHALFWLATVGSVAFAVFNKAVDIHLYDDSEAEYQRYYREFHQTGRLKPGECYGIPYSILFQGNATQFEFTSVDGKRLRIALPPYSYQQLQDNREWNWKVFAWWFHTPFDQNKAEYVVTVSLDTGDGKNIVLVDRFGQTSRDGQRQFHVVNAAGQPKVKLAVVPTAAGSGYTLEAAIPWTVVGAEPKEGLELLFDLAVDGSSDGKSRDCQLMWNGTDRNSADRGDWGRLRLER